MRKRKWLTVHPDGSPYNHPGSSYKIIRELVAAAASTGDYYQSDGDDQEKLNHMVDKVDRYIARLLKKSA